MRAPTVLAAVATVSVLGVTSCASNVPGRGTGAGPRNPSSSASSGSTSTGAPSSSSASSSASQAKPLRVVSVVADNGDTYVVKVWAEKKVPDCAAHAYGAVVAFLHKHQCTGLHQVLATTMVGDRDVGIAQRTIGFRGSPGDPYGYRAAGKFRALVSKSGTGNLNDLLREGHRLPGGRPTSVPFPNAFSAQAQDNGVSVTEAWYLSGATADNDPALVKMAGDIFLHL
ncbi:MAG: hypothetical protein ACRDVG_13150 [Jatrophihabitantaceae bacterium]